MKRSSLGGKYFTVNGVKYGPYYTVEAFREAKKFVTRRNREQRTRTRKGPKK